PALEPADSQLPLRQDCQDRLQVLRIGLELADAVAAHGCDHRVIHRGLDTAQAPLVADVAVEVIDLGPAAAHHVLQQRGPPAAAARALGGHVRLDLREPAAFVRIDEALGGNAVDRLHLEAAGPADLHGLSAHLDLDPSS